MTLIGLWWGKGRQASAPSPAAPKAMADGANQRTLAGDSAKPAIAAIPEPAFEKLAGQWRRPDGGYIIEIRSVEPDGRMDVAYFNPQPINVAQAQAYQEGERLNVYVELRDVNYPGSTYSLGYDAASDRLEGIYFQAALREQYEVYFERMK